MPRESRALQASIDIFSSSNTLCARAPACSDYYELLTESYDLLSQSLEDQEEVLTRHEKIAELEEPVRKFIVAHEHAVKAYAEYQRKARILEVEKLKKQHEQKSAVCHPLSNHPAQSQQGNRYLAACNRKDYFFVSGFWM